MRSHTHCCFCGAYNADDLVGYAGERVCHVCGKGGQGEARDPVMASDFWGYVPNYPPPLIDTNPFNLIEGNENKLY